MSIVGTRRTIERRGITQLRVTFSRNREKESTGGGDRFLNKDHSLMPVRPFLRGMFEGSEGPPSGVGGGEKSNGLTHGSWRIKTSAKSPSLGTLNVTASETWQFSCKREKGMGGASQNRSGRDLLSVWVERGGEEWER